MHMQSLLLGPRSRKIGPPSRAIGYTLEARAARDERLRGGDVFDVYMRADASVSILLADISSKGAIAGQHAGILCKEFRRVARMEPSPSRIVSALNEVAFEAVDGIPDVTFATVFVASLSPTTPGLCYTSAGHDAALIVCGRSHRHLAQTGPIIGIIRDATFADVLVEFSAGHLLVIATDGFTECRKNLDRTSQFGKAGIVRAIGSDPQRSHQSASRNVGMSADAFTGGDYGDDATLVTISWA
jgi:serine phosphatase RsbU (regulator of sigma subunit)